MLIRLVIISAACLVIGSVVISALNLNLVPERLLLAIDYASRLAMAIGTIYLACTTHETHKEMRIEKLRKSFIAIVRELRDVKEQVESNLEKLNKLNESKVEHLIYIDVGSVDVSREAIVTDFTFHYKKGLKLLKLIDTCRSEIERYNDEISRLKNALKNLVVRKLEEMGVKIDSNGYTHVCYDGNAVRFLSPEECKNLSTHRILDINDHVEAVLKGLDKVLRASKHEEELSKELANMYQEIRSSKEFKDGVAKLRHIAEGVRHCLNKLNKEIDRTIENIMKEYHTSSLDLEELHGI